MAFDPAPDTYFTGWDSDATNLTIPLAAITELTTAESDGTTGDIRKSIWAILEELHQQWAALATADKPTNMTMNVSSSANATANTITKNYTLSFVLEPSALEVVDEPA